MAIHAMTPAEQTNLLLTSYHELAARTSSYQVLLPWRSPSVTSGSSDAINATSSKVNTQSPYRTCAVRRRWT